MKRLALIGLLAAGLAHATDIIVIRLDISIPGFSWLRGVSVVTEVFVKPDGPCKSVRITVQTAKGAMTHEAAVSPYGYAGVAFPIEIIGTPTVEIIGGGQ